MCCNYTVLCFIFFPLGVKTKPCDRDSKHVFILVSASLVANKKNMFHTIATGISYFLLVECVVLSAFLRGEGGTSRYT